MDVGKRIITLRECCGLSQNGLAERAGVSQTHLRRVELGQADITVGHLQLICDAMSISLTDFFTRKPIPTKYPSHYPNYLPSKKRYY